MSEIVIQPINKSYNSALECSIAYYSVLSGLNNLNLTRGEIELLAFTNVRGTISSITAKKELIKISGTSMGTIGNIISKLSKKKLLIKIDSKIKVNPLISISFTKDLIIKLTIKNNENNS